MSSIFLETQMEMSSTTALGDFLVDGPQKPLPEAWMQSWTQHGADVMNSLAREIATLNERVGSMEERMQTCVTEKQLEVKAAETRDHFKRLGIEIHQMETQISAAFHHEAVLREALSKLLSDALGTELENRANDIEKLQAFCADEHMPDTGGAKQESAASELPVRSKQEGLGSSSPVIRFVSAVASPRATVTPTKTDAWHVPDVVGTQWEFLAAEVSDLQALLKKEVLQSQASPGDTLEVSADLKFRESLSRESLALLAKAKILDWDHTPIASTTASKSSDGSTTPDDGSNSPEVAPCPKPSSAPFYSTRTTGSDSRTGSCKLVVES
jgi:hypothetical protein